MPKNYKHIAVHSSGRVDPDKTTLECEAEGCHKEVLIGTSYSFVITFATTGDLGVPAFQCDELQHFCCSPACAAKAASACILEHLVPAHAEKTAKAAADRAKMATTTP